MSEEREEYKFDHFKNIDEVMYYFNYWYKEEDVYSINRYLSLKDFNYISNKYQELLKENQSLKKQLENCYCNRTDCYGRIKDSKQYDSLVQKVENQQKEFISYLENEKDRLARECSHIYEDSLGKTRLVNEDIFNEVDTILSKYKEITGE